MKSNNLKVRIEWNEKPDSTKGYSILSTPWSFTVEFNEAKTRVYREFKNKNLLDAWCELIIKMQYPLYNGELIKATVLN